jgi:hypothetical protein
MERKRICDMKKLMVFVVAACLLCLLVSCGPRSEKTTPTNLPTAVVFTPTSTPKSSLDEYQNREFVGENDIYSIYLINRNGGTDAAPTGELLVLNKSTNQVTKMNGLFTVIVGGGTVVFDDGKGKYVLLSIGTYSSRNGVVLSLDDQKQAGNDFCMSSGQYGDHLFWNDSILINNCDNFKNRPWGMGEAPSVTAIDLKTGTETVIAKSDLTHQYSVKQIEGNTLLYTETYVENEADWQNQDKQKTNEKTYDLTLLGSH